MARPIRTIYANTYEALQEQFDAYEWDELYTAEELSELTDDDKWTRIYSENDFWIDDTLYCLREIDKDIHNRIIAIADIGTWQGRRYGYKWVGGAEDIIYTMSSCDAIELYSNGYDICMDGYHHDGSNHCTFRMIKDNVSDEIIDRMEDALYSGDTDKADYYIRKYTKSLRPMFKKQFNI